MPEPTEEQLKAMTPEQLKEMQKQQCIFCQIVSGKVASRKIYEDDVCIAVLDINPANPGHALIMPKEHYSIMISTAVLRGLKADGTNIFIANGAAAGQKAPHFMIHLIPRRENDGITALTVPQNVMEKEDADKLRSAISRSIRARLGGREEPVSVDKPKPATVDKITKEPAKFDLDSISKMFK
jgi:histidine triad (HIT) family protein